MPSLTAHRMASWLVVLFCLANSTLLMAQSTGGRILGRVADPSAAVLAGVKVVLVNEATGGSQETQTNSTGDYGFPQVSVGTYRLEADLAGFKKSVQRGIVLDLNQVITLNVILQIGETKETVEVTSEAPLVDTTSTQLGAVMDQRQVSTLPLNARDTYQLLQLQPGVQGVGGSDLFYGSNQSGAVSVNGGRGRSNNFNVNGGDGNDLFVNSPAIQPTPDSIAEFRVLSNTFDAEYGRNSGAVINVVTKSGTNSWHGSVYEFIRNQDRSMREATWICAAPMTSRTSSEARSAVPSRRTGRSSSHRMKDAAWSMVFRPTRSSFPPLLSGPEIFRRRLLIPPQ